MISRAPAAKVEPLFKVDFIGARMAESYLGGCMPTFSISASDTSYAHENKPAIVGIKRMAKTACSIPGITIVL